jgi:hypothetical protein
MGRGSKAIFALLAACAACGLGVYATWLMWPRYSEDELPDGATVRPAVQSVAGSPISVDKTFHDFGPVLRGSPDLLHAFRVTNHTASAIKLAADKSGCSCASVECPDTIGPSETASVLLRIGTRTRKGLLASRIVLSTSDPSPPKIELKAQCVIVSRLEVEPSRLEFTDVAPGATVRKDVEVICAAEKSEEIASPEITIQSSAVHVAPTGLRRVEEAAPGLRRTRFGFRVEVDTQGLGKVAEGADLPETVTFQVALNQAPESVHLPIKVAYRTHHDLAVTGRLALRIGEKGKVRIWSRKGAPFAISKVVSEIPGLLSAQFSSDQDKGHTVEIAVSGAPGGRVREARLFVYSDRFPDAPVAVPVFVLPIGLRK